MITVSDWRIKPTSFHVVELAELDRHVDHNDELYAVELVLRNGTTGKVQITRITHAELEMLRDILTGKDL